MLLLLQCGQSIVIAQDSFWIPTNGPFGGDVGMLATDGNVVYATCDRARLFKSTNDGKTWLSLPWPKATRTVFSVNRIDLKIEPAGRLTLGEFRTTDDGEQWIELLDGASKSIVDSRGTIYRLYDRIQKSTNKGASWTIFDSSATLVTFEQDVFYAFRRPRPEYVWNDLFMSTDFGGSWIDLPNPPRWDYERTRLVITKNNHLHFGVNYISSSPRTYRNSDYIFYSLRDSNRGWDSVYVRGDSSGQTSPYVTCMIDDSKGFLYAGTHSGVVRSTDDGNSWQLSNHGMTNTRITTLCCTNTGTLLAGTTSLYGPPGTTASGMYRSTNRGETWILSNSGLTATQLNTIAVDQHNRLYAGGLGVYQSDDRGNSWNLIALKSTTVYALAVDQDGDLHASCDLGLLRSSDHGKSWDKTFAHSQYVAALQTRKILFHSALNSLYRSTDNGSTWKFVANHQVEKLFETKGQLLFAETQTAILQSKDLGLNWDTLNVRKTSSSSLAASRKGYLFLRGVNGVVRSSNEGKTWNDSVAVKGTIRVLGSTEQGSLLVETEENLVLIDGNWKSKEFVDQPLLVVGQLVFDSEGFAYAATRGQGVLKSRFPINK